MVKIMKKMGSPSKGPVYALPYSVLLTLQQAAADPRLHQGLLDTHRLVWVSLCGVTAPFSWVLVRTSLCLCPPSLFPQSCVLAALWWG